MSRTLAALALALALPSLAAALSPTAPEGSTAVPLVLQSGRELWVKAPTIEEGAVLFWDASGLQRLQLPLDSVDWQATSDRLRAVAEARAAKGGAYRRITLTGDPEHAAEEAAIAHGRHLANYQDAMRLPDPSKLERDQEKLAAEEELTRYRAFEDASCGGSVILPAGATAADVAAIQASLKLQCAAEKLARAADRATDTRSAEEILAGYEASLYGDDER